MNLYSLMVELPANVYASFNFLIQTSSFFIIACMTFFDFSLYGWLINLKKMVRRNALLIFKPTAFHLFAIWTISLETRSIGSFRSPKKAIPTGHRQEVFSKKNPPLFVLN